MAEVTAVPIRPVRRGTLVKLWLGLILLCLAAAGLAWLGTRPLQEITLPSGARYRVVSQGHGAPMTPADVAGLRYKLHVNSLEAPTIQDSDENGGQLFATSIQEVFPGFADALTHMREGGRYLLWLPPGTHVSGNPPPGAPFTPRDTLVFQIEMVQIARNMASQRQMMMMQQMMQQQQQQQGGAGAPPGAGGAGGAPPAGNSAGTAGRRGR
jgi:FKBP-type peptidyl-prolyl cis-trans isomerase FkpA